MKTKGICSPSGDMNDFLTDLIILRVLTDNNTVSGRSVPATLFNHEDIVFDFFRFPAHSRNVFGSHIYEFPAGGTGE